MLKHFVAYLEQCLYVIWSRIHFGAAFIESGGALISHMEWNSFNDKVKIVYAEHDIASYRALVQ